MGELRSKYQSTGVDITKARTDIKFAQSEYDRYRQLFEKGFTTQARLGKAQHALDVAFATPRETQALVRLTTRCKFRCPHTLTGIVVRESCPIPGVSAA